MRPLVHSLVNQCQLITSGCQLDQLEIAFAAIDRSRRILDDMERLLSPAPNCRPSGPLSH